MLSYRHAYHAGNHADILKHMVLCLILRSLLNKDKPYTIIDTHAGAGIYNLNSAFASKNAEFKSGYSKIKDNEKLQKLIPEFYQVIAHTKEWASKDINHQELYPGSPLFSAILSRSSDSIFLSDLHKGEFESLFNLFKRKKNVHVELRDGLQALKALLPPIKRRGLILIDPSYEIKHDYIEVVKALKEGYKRFNQGIFALWYPVLGRLNDHSKKLVQDIKRTNIPLLQVELRVDKQEEEFGMCGSGMLILNYPYQMYENLEPIVDELVKALAYNEHASANLTILNAKP